MAQFKKQTDFDFLKDIFVLITNILLFFHFKLWEILVDFFQNTVLNFITNLL